jgi:precorrin-2 dehydrogenase/sirohydrochlorin ferrochelatase
MEAFPAFFPLSGARVVIAGRGDGAEAKARLLSGSPAEVARIEGERAFEADAYAGAALAFVAHPDAGFCERASAAAKSAGVAVNVVDHAELSDFHTPAIIDRGQVVAAIGTGGAAPMLAALLRADLEAKVPTGLGALSELLGRLRAEIRAAFPDLAQRRAFLRTVLVGDVAHAADAGEMKEAERRLRRAIDAGITAAGRLWLIEAPARRDLLSLRAAKALAEADVLAPSDDAPPEVLVLARRDASWRKLGDMHPPDLMAEVEAGRQVVVVAGSAAIEGLAARLKVRKAAFERLAPAPEA